MLSQALSEPFTRSKRLMNFRALVKWGALGAVSLLAFYLILALYLQRQFMFALLFLVLAGSAIYIFARSKAYTYRYIFPALAGMSVFVLFPLFYTVAIGFTNYSADNLLTLPRVQQVLLSQTYQVAGGRHDFTLHQQGSQYRLSVTDDQGQVLVTSPFSLDQAGQHEKLALHPAGSQPIAGDKVNLRGIIQHRQALGDLTLVMPDNTLLSMASLRSFGAVKPRYTLHGDDTLTDNKTGQTFHPNDTTGFYQSADGQTLSPGWTVAIGWANYVRVLTDPSIRGPFIQIFTWTVTFALLTVVLTLGLGLLLANVLQWDQMRGKGFYRTMLILPYAVPAFISILIFKGLFNQNFGEINLVLQHLFGVRPDWFSDPFLAKVMILIVNTWLGYPYMMLLCMGLLQSIPRDLYEASAMDGAGPIDNLFRITIPLIIKPMMPLLIASFAFNFNNFVLIALLTNGAPDIIGASTPAGTTDLLVSYTYRIAFQDAGQNFGLAAAIATVIFLLVGGLSLLNLKLSKIKV